MNNRRLFSFRKLFSAAVCAALAALLCGEAFAETNMAELAPQERIAWEAHGFSAQNGAEWKYYGIKPEDAVRWKTAGIIFPAWAKQWIGEGFTPEEAGEWKDAANVYTAGEFKKRRFSTNEAIEWIKSGIPSALLAEEFRAAGLKLSEAAEFWRLRIFPEEAAQWVREGFSAAETLEWHYGPKDAAYFHTKKSPSSRHAYPLEWAKQWRRAGFIAADARRADDCEVDLDTAVKWRTAGFTVNETIKWRDSGFDIGEASAMKATGIAAGEADEKRYAQNPAQADSITSFHSDITLKPDGALDVIETIDIVNAPEGAYKECFYKIILRSIDLKYRVSSYKTANPDYTLISAYVDGREAVFEKRRDGSFCIGGNTPLSNGPHFFTVRYITNDRLLTFDDHDELSYDVTGGYSDYMPRRNVSATVRLPKGAEIIFADGRAGLPERRDFSVRVEETPDGDIAHYRALRPLKDRMNFRVSVAFLKGYVDQGLPHRIKKFDRKTGRLLTSLAIFLTGFGATLAYYVIAWRRVGVDPKSGPVVIEFSAPEGMTPARARLLHTTAIDLISASATLVGLAEAGRVNISEKDGAYKISKTSKSVPVTDALDTAFLENLFAGAESVSTGDAGAQRRLNAAMGVLKKELRHEFKKYYSANTKALLPGLGISLLTVAASFIVVDWGSFRSHEAVRIIAVYGIFLTAVFGTLAEVFRRALSAPTTTYVKLKGRIGGYRAYLEANYPKSGSRMTGLPPQMQKHLSYAMALGIEDKNQMIPEGKARWFTGTSGGFSGADFVAALKGKG